MGPTMKLINNMKKKLLEQNSQPVKFVIGKADYLRLIKKDFEFLQELKSEGVKVEIV